ncbi:MAG: hypothetical protein GY777_16875 [Candidatus Brocadiaceae bacterium]|nr:hypothetical protein [Candidatus Brocadiaceae bacterium]
MAKKRQKSEHPGLLSDSVKKRRSNITSQLERWFRAYPVLRIAYREVNLRFGKANNVFGIGIGRKYSESENRYLALPKSTGGLCIKIFVERKLMEVDRDERIPAWINISVPGEEKKRRVLLDIVSVGGKVTNQPVIAKLQRGKVRWPLTGKLNPGNLFAFRQYINNKPVTKVGTTGVLIRYQDGSHFGISASHVFTDPCRNNYNSPVGECELGTLEDKWRSVRGGDFFPPVTKTSDCIRDVMRFPAPADFIPDGVIWPDGFLKELATQNDIDRAVKAETVTGFIWVDRAGQRKKIDVDLEAGIPKFKIHITCDNNTRKMVYVMVWPMRFKGDTTTLKGDSGSPVFLYSEDNSGCRLLGIHFLEVEDGNHAYAMDAKSFFRDILLSTPNKDVWFA